MADLIYGVDLNSNFTSKDVRDAIMVCFRQAHDDILEQTFSSTDMTVEEIEKFKDMDIRVLLKKTFEKVGGDYDNPTRESLIGVINELKQFALNFRAEDIAKKNLEKIMELINNLK